MKKLISLLIAICIAGSVFSQSALKTVRQKVGNPDILKNWNVGEEKLLTNASVLRVEGANDINHRTNLFYTANGGYLEEAPGGQISLFFDRNIEELADPGLFTITVKDSDGNELYQKCLNKDNRPFYYKWEIWYYTETVNIPVLVSKTFTVMVEDAGLGKKFEFLVTIQQDSEFMPQPLLSSVDHHLLY